MILLVLGALALFAILSSREPDSKLLESVQSLPLVGPLARGFRDRYLIPKSGRSRELATTEFSFDLSSRDRADDQNGLPWIEGFESWSGDGPPPLGNDPLPPRPLPGREADPERLAEARLHLRAASAEGLRLGPYPLVTDVIDGALLDRLSQAAAGVEEFYIDRYGVETVGAALETVVLYRREEDYRALQRRWAGVVGPRAAIGSLLSQGHSGYGLVVLFVGSSSSDGVAGTLLHELAHVLNRRALGPALPFWLEEGIADDVGAARPDTSGGIALGDFIAPAPDEVGTIRLQGPLAALSILARSQRDGSLLSLPLLVEIEREHFLAEADAALHYGHSAFFVRFLLSEASALAESFRRFLAGVAAGESVAPSALEQQLGVTLAQIEAEWRRYLVQQILHAGLGNELTAPR